jgi:hypothetical protein
LRDFTIADPDGFGIRFASLLDGAVAASPHGRQVSPGMRSVPNQVSRSFTCGRTPKRASSERESDPKARAGLTLQTVDVASECQG